MPKLTEDYITISGLSPTMEPNPDADWLQEKQDEINYLNDLYVYEVGDERHGENWIVRYQNIGLHLKTDITSKNELIIYTVS